MTDANTCPDCGRPELTGSGDDARVSAVCWERGGAVCVRVQRDAAIARAERAERERDEAWRTAEDFNADRVVRVKAALAERDEARAQLAAVRKAAEPFAREAACWFGGDELRPFIGSNKRNVKDAKFTLGDLRRVAALATPAGKDTDSNARHRCMATFTDEKRLTWHCTETARHDGDHKAGLGNGSHAATWPQFTPPAGKGDGQ